jgi:DNA-binding CsgD family transcriptional regulator
VGIILARTSGQPDFSDREQSVLSSVLPALETLTRRSDRLDGQLRSQPFLESMLELSPSPKIILDPRGAFVWASERAEAFIAMSSGGCKTVPDVLVKAAQSLGALTGKNSGSSVPLTSVAIPGKDSSLIRANLRLARNRNGAYFIIAELEEPGVSPLLKETATRYQLTKAETQVLNLISVGLSDREIGRRLFVSLATVHTHVVRILDKLGVRSRVQAALLAHGHKSQAEPDDE